MSLIWQIPSPPINVLHSQQSPDWYTPSPYVEAARHVMGGIDLDPASDAVANHIIQATTFYTEVQNGLLQPWKGRVFLNPPGGQVNAFWTKLIESLSQIDQFVWIGYSLEQLQTLQGVTTLTPLNFWMCYPKSRIAFVENAAKRSLRLAKCLKEHKPFKEKGSPSHANYIAYYGQKGDFQTVFSSFGQCVPA